MALTSIKDVSSNGPSAIFKPGNIEAKVSRVYLEEDRFKPGAYYLMLQLEGRDLGENFKGFLIDSTDESKGRRSWQTANVRASLYSFEDKKVGNKVYIRDDGILKALSAIAAEMDLTDQVNTLPVPENIQEYTESIGKVLIDSGTYLHWCLGGKEYVSKTNKTNYTLFLAKADFRSNKSYSKRADEVVPFSAATHIVKKKTLPTVEGFGFEASHVAGDFTI